MAANDGLLRARDGTHDRVAPIELFFDLLYVLAVTQLTHQLLTHLTLRGAVETLLLLLAVWTAWMYTGWITSWFDPSTLPVRLMLVGVMLGSLLMSAAIPEAFSDRGLEFAGAYVAIQVGRTVWVLAVVGRRHDLSANFQRVLVWLVGIGAVWLAGALVEGDARLALWTLAVVLDLTAVWLAFPVPRLGRSQTSEWTIGRAPRRALPALRHHRARRVDHRHRRRLRRAARGRGDHRRARGRVRRERRVLVDLLRSRRRARPGDHRELRRPGPVGPLGVLLLPRTDDRRDHRRRRRRRGAARAPARPGHGGDDCAHPGRAGAVPRRNALFKWTVWEYVPWSRLVAIAALAALVPVAAVTSALVLGLCATAVVVALAVRDTVVTRRPGYGHGRAVDG